MLGKTVTVRDEMKIKDVDNVCIVEIGKNQLSQAELSDLKRLLYERQGDFRVGINLKGVDTVSSDLLCLIKDCTKDRKISLFNLNNDIFLLIYVLKMEREFDIYLNENDFLSERLTLVRRRLKVVAA